VVSGTRRVNRWSTSLDGAVGRMKSPLLYSLATLVLVSLCSGRDRHSLSVEVDQVVISADGEEGKLCIGLNRKLAKDGARLSCK
jgi:hypothetical protein